MDFLYQAKTQAGNLVSGRVEAPNEDQAVSVLHQKQLVILSLTEAPKGIFEKDIFLALQKPNQKDLVLFTRQLATLVEADVPLVEGLHTLVRQTEKEVFKRIITSIASSVEGGAALSVALSEHSRVFGQFYVSLVKAGEVSGKLQTTLLYLADYLERSAGLTSKIKGALAYPSFVFFALIVVTAIIFTTVLPQLLSIIKDAGVQEIPLTTKILIVVTDFINKFFVLIIIVLLIAAINLFYYVKTPQGRIKWDNIKIQLPQFGRVIRGFYLARIAETLSTLVKAGVPILEGLNITADVVGNVIYRDIILEARTNVQGGGTISEVLAKYREFPPLVSSMLAVGEKTGRTDFMLENIFKFYKTEAENDIQNLSQLIEPILILVLGLGVGILVSAILLPIYSLVGTA